MANVTCSCCGEVFPDTMAQCPLCSTENKNYVGNSASSDATGDSVECSCCGEVYGAELSKCPVCGFKNNKAAKTEEVAMSNNAVLIDEDGEYIPKRQVKKSSSKQNTPNSYLVLASFIGIIIIIISLLVGAFSNITKKESSKIGMDVFEQREYRGLQY